RCRRSAACASALPALPLQQTRLLVLVRVLRPVWIRLFRPVSVPGLRLRLRLRLPVRLQQLRSVRLLLAIPIRRAVRPLCAAAPGLWLLLRAVPEARPAAPERDARSMVTAP